MPCSTTFCMAECVRPGEPKMINYQRIKLTLYISLSFLISIVSAFIAPGTPHPAQAASTYVVTSTADSGGTCPDPANCTLRAAITAANGNTGSTITFDN